jgi:DNA-binding response OmpR family regulator
VTEAEADNEGPPLVLVADDEADILDLIALHLEADGNRVVKARDGEVALGLAKELRPDVAVIDVMMPRRDGFSIAEELRADDSIQRVPVILLTAKVQEKDVMEGWEAGAVEYMKKPFDAKDLCARVREVARRSRAARARRSV